MKRTEDTSSLSLSPTRKITRKVFNSFSVRPYHTTDVEKALQLLKSCFPNRIDYAEWTWKYDQGFQVPFQVAESGGELVGMYPVLTLRLKLGNEVRLVMQPQDVCIHPDYRGGKILRAMLKANESTARVSGIPFMFGFPTEGHFKVGIRMLGYKDLFRLMVWRRSLSRGLRIQSRLPSGLVQQFAYSAGSTFQEILLIGKRKKRAMGQGIEVTNLQQFNVIADRLWEKISHQVHFGIVRDANYLNWRYVKRPGHFFHILGVLHHGHLEGYCIFRDNLIRPDGIRAGVLMDLVAIEPAVTQVLMDAALARMRKARCGYVMALTHTAMDTASILANAGFVPDPHAEPIIFCTPYSGDLNLQELKQPSNWLLAYGDTDHMG
jgi:GNAT superfamily N-acetyltransferase